MNTFDCITLYRGKRVRRGLRFRDWTAYKDASVPHWRCNG